MYKYVENKEFLEKARKACNQIIGQLVETLRKDYKIACEAFLIGSGARNMVTQNEKGPIDFDFNLNVYKGFNYGEKKLKDTVREAFNKVMRSMGLQDVEDSTSSLTTKLFHFTDDPSINLKIDLCIVTKGENELWNRLKHEKARFNGGVDKFYWNEAPNSSDYNAKSQIIKSKPGWWDKVRSHYLDIKNDYLKKNDHDHPSFVCYIQAVNDVYNEMRQKRLI